MKHEDCKSIPTTKEEPEPLIGGATGETEDSQHHRQNPEPGPRWSLRSLGINGYMAKVQEHLDKRGFTGDPPTQKRYVEAWNAQTCAKKLAASHIRRARRQAMNLRDRRPAVSEEDQSKVSRRLGDDSGSSGHPRREG